MKSPTTSKRSGNWVTASDGGVFHIAHTAKDSLGFWQKNKRLPSVRCAISLWNGRSKKMANEKRLIDANALMAYIHNHDYELVSRMGCVDKGMFTDGIEHGINIQQAVDAVEVVRCKDCARCFKHTTKRNRQMMWICMRNEMDVCVRPDDFCSYGERRTGG